MKECVHGKKVEIITNTSDVCRDFLRNVCNRENRCKFKHFMGEELNVLVDTRNDPASSNMKYEFCHDFQNVGCDRLNCKFIHCSKDIEAEFLENGLLPLRLKYEYELGLAEICEAMENNANKRIPIASSLPQDKMKPLCRDYIKRHCRRGKKCRFVHLDQNDNYGDTDYSRHNIRQLPNQDPNMHIGSENNPEKKRLRLNPGNCGSEAPVFTLPSEGEGSKSITCLVPAPSNASTVQFIQEENLMLRKELDNLRKQVSDLSATNEVLLEQNARFRLQKHCFAEGAATSFSQAKNFASQSPLAVSVPIAMSLNVPAQNQRMAGNPGLAGAPMLTSDTLAVTPVEMINSSPGQQPLNTVNVMPHSNVPAQAHIQISRSIAQNNSGLVSNIVTNNSRLLDDLHTLSNHPANVGPNQAGLHASTYSPITPVLQQTNMASQSVANFTITQNTLPISQNLNCSMPSLTTSSVSGTLMQNPHPSIISVCPSMAGQNTITLNQSQGTQNMPANSGLVVQANHNIAVDTEGKSIGHINHNIASAQMTHAALVANTQQNQNTARQTAGNLSASFAAVAAQVIAAQGSLQAQANNEIGTAQISVPAVQHGNLASTIVPVTITTTLPMAIVPSLSIDNSASGMLGPRMEGVGGPQKHGTRVSMVTSCPSSIVSMSLTPPAHQVVNALSGRRVVSAQQQLNGPINFTINPVATVSQQPGPGMHAQ